MFKTNGCRMISILGMWVVLVSWLSVASAWAVEETAHAGSADNAFTNPLDKRFTFYGGFQFYQAEGEFSSTRDGRPESSVDLNELGQDENAVSPIVVLKLILGERWNLRFDYFGYHDDATNTADFEFEFDDVIIPIGARTDSSIDLDVYVLNLSYNFIHTERARFGVGVGVHAVDIDVSISGSVSVAGNHVPLGEGEEDFIAPVPNLYVSGAYAFTDRLLIRFGAGWLSADYDDYSGQLLTANAMLEYWPFQYTGFGFGYRYLEVDVDYTPEGRKDTYDVKLPGPLLYVTVGF